jgi:hypothetical protein
MPKTCIICRVVTLQYCGECKSAFYCTRTCQKEDWKTQHKQICKLLNVGHGDMQVRSELHAHRSIESREGFESLERTLPEDMKRFFKLFTESTFEGSRVAAKEMKKLAKRQDKPNQMVLLLHSLTFLVRFSNSEMFSWPNSPLLVLLQFVDSIVRIEETSTSLLQLLASLADPIEYSTHVNQLILAKQLIDHGNNVNTVSMPQALTPLHEACSAINVTNLDFVELLLKKGADPNAQNPLGLTPLWCTIPHAPGAAKFLLNWPATNVDITSRSGASFLARVRSLITYLSDQIALPDNPEQIQTQFLLQQWREIEEMLVERGAIDTGISNLNP